MKYRYNVLLFTYLLLISFYAGAQADSSYILYNTSRTTAYWLHRPFYSAPAIPLLLGSDDTIAYSLKFNSQREVLLSFDSKVPRAVMLYEFFGHLVYTRPGDTIRIDVDSLPNNKSMLKPGMPSGWSVRYHYKGPKQYEHALFDTLTWLHGSLHLVLTTIKSANYNLDKLIDTAVLIKEERFKFLHHYSRRHNLPDDVVDYAKAQINWHYASTLVGTLRFYQAGYTKAMLSKRYNDSINAINWQPDEYFFSSPLQHSAILNYLHYYKLPFNADSAFNSKGIDNSITHIKQNYKPDVAALLASQQMGIHVNNGVLPSENVLIVYRQMVDSNSLYVKGLNKRIDDLIAIRSDYGYVLRQTLIDTATNKLVFADLLGKQPVLVDCWASWCKPCIDQLPSLHKMQAKYGSRIRFVSLSFDTDITKWQASVAKHALSGTDAFLAGNNFKSDLANYFSIRSIPRYLLFDAQGKLVSSHCPFPDQEEALGALLEKSLANEKL